MATEIDMNARRAEYRAVPGKNPSPGWRADARGRRIPGGRAGNPDPDPPRPQVEMKQVVITADHTYLPLDEQGNARSDWATTSDEQSKVAKRTRLMVPADLAEMLSGRDIAEII